MDKATFETLYGSAGTTFPNNTSGLISEEDMRTFGQDIKDSAHFIEGNRASLNTSGALTINMDSNFYRAFVGSAAIAANKTATITNVANAVEFKLFLEFSGSYYLQFPSNCYMVDVYEGGIWDNSTKRLTLGIAATTTKYRIIGTFDGTDWQIDVVGPYKL
jgi:hypothetical protein